MGIKKMVKYSVGAAVAGIAAYELARMMKKPGSSREERMQTREYAPSREERMQTREYVPPQERIERMETPEYRPEEPRDPRDYRSIYNL
ncbi:hypothetical protein [Methanocella sp. MCL-LM]|uniref:hypothetical protein n=1 Tax=Methanocella sp. MCL-LM TaxID=3412035 RepID=UPI003C71EB42